MSFEDINSNSPKKKTIKKHQILDLAKFGKFDYVNAGFIINFRDEEKGVERSYYQNINDFMHMCANISKTSFNEIDLIMNGAIKINGELLRVNYRWDICKLISDVTDKKYGNK